MIAITIKISKNGSYYRNIILYDFDYSENLNNRMEFINECVDDWLDKNINHNLYHHVFDIVYDPNEIYTIYNEEINKIDSEIDVLNFKKNKILSELLKINKKK